MNIRNASIALGHGCGRALLAFGFFSALGSTAAVAQESKPAVSEPNFKGALNLGHGQIEGDTAKGFVWYAEGAFTLPVGKAFGMQLDGALGTFDGRFFRSVAGHAFWRNPDLALLGATFQYQGLAGADVYRFGGEGEFYWRWLTVAATAGYQTGNPNRSKSIRPGQGAYGLLDLKVYPMPDLMLRIGGGFAPLRKDERQGVIRFGAEFQPRYARLPGLTYFVQGDVGLHRHHVVTAGVRLYFGLDGGMNAKPLIRRHREDDPDFITTQAVQGFQKGANNVTNNQAPGCPEGQIPNGQGGCFFEES